MDYLKRIRNLQQIMKSRQLDIMIIDDLINIFYLTGLALSAGQIVVTTAEAFLIVDGRYYEHCRKQSPIPTSLLSETPLKSMLKSHVGNSGSIGFDAETTSYRLFIEYYKFVQEIESAELKPLPNLVKELRTIKDSEEQTLLKQAADLGCEGFEYVKTLLKPGITEREVAVELEIFWRRHGGKKLAFDPIIAFGPNSSMPHHRTSDRTLQHNDIALIDIGVNLNDYQSDMTRVLFLGKPKPELQEIYAIVKEAKEAALRICKPGISIGELDAAARDLITNRGFGKLFTHGLGHGVGLEIHELPVVKGIEPYKSVILQPGMVLTIEPGIYLPDVGGVRLEDTVIITNEGFKNLTHTPC